jgi:hypothetical protein
VEGTPSTKRNQKKEFSRGVPPPSLPRGAGEGALQTSPFVPESLCMTNHACTHFSTGFGLGQSKVCYCALALSARVLAIGRSMRLLPCPQ